MEIIEEIRQALIIAEQENRKMATFHAMVLIHAGFLLTMDPHEFCRSVGVPDSYCTEFRKMISARNALSGFGYSIAAN